MIRVLIALVAIAAVGAWAFSTYRRTQALGDFLAYEETPGVLAEILETAPETLKVPPAAEAKLLVASIYGQAFFPPEDGKAVEWAASALENRPLESGLWVVLARHLFFSGDTEGARIALGRADELDPNYPLQRIKAIQLWTLIGERDRAGILAAQIASLGNQERNNVARELLRLGWDRAEIFARLVGGSLPDNELIDLITILKTNDRVQSRALLDAIPEGRVGGGNRAMRAMLSRHAADALLMDQIERLWRLERPQAPSEPRYPSDFTELGLVFERPPLAFGWQGLPMENWVIVRPRMLDVAGAIGSPATRVDGLEVQYRDTPEENRRVSRWVFYRVPVPAGEQLAVRMQVRMVPSDRATARINAYSGRTRVNSNSTDLRTDLVQTLHLTMVPESSDRVVTLELERTRARSIFDTEAELLIFSLELESTPVATTSISEEQP